MSDLARTATSGRAWQGRSRRQQDQYERCQQDGNNKKGMAVTPAKQQHQDGRMHERLRQERPQHKQLQQELPWKNERCKRSHQSRIV